MEMSSHFLKQLHLCHTCKLEISMKTDTCVLIMSLNFHTVSSIPSYQIYKEYLPILRVMVGSLDEVVL